MSFLTSRSASLSAPSSTRPVGLPISPSPHVRAALSSPPSPTFSSAPLVGGGGGGSRPAQCSRCLSRPQRASHKKQKTHVPVPAANPRPASSIFRLGQRLKDEIRGRFRAPTREEQPVLSVAPPGRTASYKSSLSSSSSSASPKQTSPLSKKPAMSKMPAQPEIVPDHWADY